MSFEQYRKPTRRERFLNEMNRVVPWADLVATIESVYPKAEGPGRPLVGVERILRLYCLQQWFNLSDPAVEVIPCHAPEAKRFIQTKAHRHRPRSEAERVRNRTKSKVRAKVEHACLVIKRIFGWATVRYRGARENTNWLFVSCGVTNLYLARRRLLAGT